MNRVGLFERRFQVTTNFPSKGLLSKCRVLFISLQVANDPVFSYCINVQFRPGIYRDLVFLVCLKK